MKLVAASLLLLSMVAANPLAGNEPEPQATTAAEEASSQSTASTELDAFLRDGRLTEGLERFAKPTDNAERFSLGVLQAVAGVQAFSVGANQLELAEEFGAGVRSMPFFRVIVKGAAVPNPEPATPEKVAALFLSLRAALAAANATLASVDDEEFKVEVNMSQVRLDLDGDGTAEEPLLASVGNSIGLPATTDGGGDIVLRFDNADAVWLRGYTHLTGGMLDVLTAYDWRPVWDQAAHHIFANPVPMPAIVAVAEVATPGMGMMSEAGRIADAVAAIHSIRLQVADPEGLARARDQFRAMVTSSRLMWELANAETDDDMEWIPSPTQTGPNDALVTADQVTAWMAVLDELDAVLRGDRLMPHWRFKPGHGINLDKLAKSPPTLDLIMLIHGGGFIPYVEQGDVSDTNTWEALTSPFGGSFGGFALWVN